MKLLKYVKIMLKDVIFRWISEKNNQLMWDYWFWEEYENFQRYRSPERGNHDPINSPSKICTPLCPSKLWKWSCHTKPYLSAVASQGRRRDLWALFSLQSRRSEGVDVAVYIPSTGRIFEFALFITRDLHSLIHRLDFFALVPRVLN